MKKSTVKIATILGARPQFVKAVVVSRKLSGHKRAQEIIVHTGQHFDRNMSEVFFKELKLVKPKYNLNINSLDRTAMIMKMLEGIAKVLRYEKPDLVLVYGDTNSTLAGALAAKKTGLKLAHIEAGLRSFNFQMPEEINRVVTDRISDILFCPTDNAVANLKKEGLDTANRRIIKSGDVMLDAANLYSNFAKKPFFALPQEFVLATVHRQENTGDLSRLRQIIYGLNRVAREIKVIFPLHPRTRKIIAKNKIKANFSFVDPVSYLEMVYLIKKSSLIMTDSGGLQKEAFFFKKPCVTLRDQTEWQELVENGVNCLSGASQKKIYTAYRKMLGKKLKFDPDLYGRGLAAERIVKEILV